MGNRFARCKLTNVCILSTAPGIPTISGSLATAYCRGARGEQLCSFPDSIPTNLGQLRFLSANPLDIRLFCRHDQHVICMTRAALKLIAFAIWTCTGCVSFAIAQDTTPQPKVEYLTYEQVLQRWETSRSDGDSRDLRTFARDMNRVWAQPRVSPPPIVIIRGSGFTRIASRYLGTPLTSCSSSRCLGFSTRHVASCRFTECPP